MMSVEQLKNIETLINLPPGQKIISQKVKRLTAPGENYGSLMLQLDLTIEAPNGTEELNLVAKTIPPNEFIQEIFNTQVTFRNEIGFYKTIVPVLQNFQKEQGVQEVIDFAAKCYGSRLNLNDDNGKVDSDAALILENLRIANYTMLPRLEGVDLQAAKLVLKNLAHLHAVPLALKLKNPEIFEKQIKPYLAPWQLVDDQLLESRKTLARLIDGIDELKPLRERALAGFDKISENSAPREPWATITHNDCWTNNNMFLLDGNKPVKNIIVDFQVCSYGSPAKDINFWIFSSVKQHVIECYYDELLKVYHNTFLNDLEELKCDTTPFTFDSLLKEIDFEAGHSQFGHISFMLLPLYMAKEDVVDFTELKREAPEPKITDLIKEKYSFFINEFARRRWI